MERAVGRAKNLPNRRQVKGNEKEMKKFHFLLGNEKSNWYSLGSHTANQ